MGSASLHHARLSAVLLLGLAGLPAAPASAQNQGLVVRDGSLGSGPAGAVLPGPDDLGTATYLIRADLGEQRDGNLFHSFTRFSIRSGERATFTDQGAPDPGAIDNVISRVTGGEASQIDGTLRSTIPGADVWLFNPSGVGFGAGAEIDVRGSFHASTADSVEFEDGDEPFRARATPEPVLATAKPSAFGFLPDGASAALAVEGSRLAVEGSRLEVDPGETLALVARGDLSLTGAKLFARGGHVGLEAQGRVALSQSLVDVRREGDTPGTISIRGGQIEIKQGSRVMAENESSMPSANPDEPGPGRIAVAASESVRVDGSLLSVSTHGAGNAGTIEIRDADLLVIGSRGSIIADTTGAGNAGAINILEAGSLVISEGFLGAQSFGAGNAGAINILDTGSLVIESGVISTSTRGTGNAGTVTARTDSVTIGPGPPGPDRPAFISSSSLGSADADFMVGNAGTIDVEAKSILLTNEGGALLTIEEILDNPPPLPITGISSSTLQGGEGGKIRLKAQDITVQEGAAVATSTVSGGNAGTIELLGDRILVTKGGWVDSTSLPDPDPRLDPGAARDSGDAGAVTLYANEWIEVSGPGRSEEFGVGQVSSSSVGSGAAGAVTLHAPTIKIDAGAVLTQALPSSDEQREGTGGGSITLDAISLDGARGELLVTNGGRVDASTFIAGEGGRIDATAGQSIRVEGEGSGIASRTGGTGLGGSVALVAPQIHVRAGGEVSAESAPGFGALEGILSRGIGWGLIGVVTTNAEDVRGNAGSVTLQATKLVHLDGGDITTSVGVAQGGKITIDPIFVILQHGGSITSEALLDTGKGGEIQIATDNFLHFPGSRVSAQGRTPELSGTVEIHSPDVNLAGALAELPTNFLDAASLMRERCAARKSGERSGSFAVRGPGGIPAEPDGWLPAPLLPDTATTTAATAGAPVLVASLSGPLLLYQGCP